MDRTRPSFVIYVDESGDEGFSFDRGSSQWFVVSAVITRKTTDLETVKLVDKVRAALKRPEKKPLHFRDLRHEHRLPFVDEVAKARLRTVSVLVHKPSIKEPEKFDERFRLYFYSMRLLLERVSWLCRDHRGSDDTGDGTAEVIVSNRAGVSQDEMTDYLELLKRRSELDDVRIDWNVIRANQFYAFSAGKRMGLQIADAVASSTWYAVNPSKHGYTEDRYIRMLKPVTYHHKSVYLGYGLKFWPSDVDKFLGEDTKLGWFHSDFK